MSGDEELDKHIKIPLKVPGGLINTDQLMFPLGPRDDFSRAG